MDTNTPATVIGKAIGAEPITPAVSVTSHAIMSAQTNRLAGAGTLEGTFGFPPNTSSGGAVTQASSITTGVTLNKPTGQITTVASTLGAGLEATFTVTNDRVTAKDVVLLSTTYAGAGTPFIFCSKVASGSFNVTITNLHASAALDALLLLNFIVFRAASN